MEVRFFTQEHLEMALRLSNQVGWNHLKADWARCVDLNPNGCLGGFIDGQMMSTCTINQFGDFGWVGTFLVDQEHQRKGFGSVMFNAMLKQAQALGIEWLALDSTEAGRLIYTRCGFVQDESIERWTGPNAEGEPEDTLPLDETHWPSLLEMDAANTGVNRERQLRHLAGEPGAAVRVLERGGKVVAYGFSRPGRLAGSIGPLVAEDFGAARKILNALLSVRRALDGEGGIALDALEHGDFKELLTQKGFVMRRRLIRMFRPEKRRSVLSGGKVFAATALGMG